MSDDSALMVIMKKSLAGGLCAMTSHVVTVPFDVIKTIVQIDSVKYGSSLGGAARVLVATEGVSGLFLGLTPTFCGYMLQGALKFMGFDVIREHLTGVFPDAPRLGLYLGSAAIAETFASIVLTPFEALRIRMVAGEAGKLSFVSFASSLIARDGLGSLYRGLLPILAKQLPYTMVQLAAFTTIIDIVGRPESGSAALMVSIGAGAAAGCCSAVASHPPDSLLTRVNVHSGESLLQAARALGWRGMWAGLGPRLVPVSSFFFG